MDQQDPQRVPFPLNVQFSCPAKYHTQGQKFKIGDLVWYELKGSFRKSNEFIQWGEGIVKSVDYETNVYTLAGKTWDYDHYIHPLLGTPNGPAKFFNVSSAEESRMIYKKWTQTHHPNSFVRRNALLGVDEVMHPGLTSVPGEAMFKVWDRVTFPKSPIETNNMNLSSSATSPFSHDDNLLLETARDHFGPDLQFKGVKQNGLGPEMWGITLDQLLAVKNLHGYDESMLMYDVVEKLIKPITKGKGIGYALLINSEKPLRAKIMTSHAWGERYDHFVRAIKDSNAEGPFWVCAMSIYQNEDIPSISIFRQLGPSLEHGPFATVLKQATTMFAIFTPAVDIYMRMWCVFEVYIAVKYGVPVKFVALSYQYLSGIQNIYDSIFEHGKKKVSSVNARCGDPSQPLNDDERRIRSMIQAYPGAFHTIDSVIEWCKATYHIGETMHPGLGFRSDPEHYLFLGGPKRFDFLAKNLSSIALALDRMEEASIAASEKDKINNEGQGFRCNYCCIS